MIDVKGLWEVENQGFWMFSEVLFCYLVIVLAAIESDSPLAADATKVLGGAVASWGAQYLLTRGQTSAST
jgi:hypothetical protein